MGFALWMDDEIACAQGTHEYRPMGVAIIARNDLFKARDFRPNVKTPRYPARAFAGYFASLGDMNDYLRRREGHVWRGGYPL